jgi:ABC-type branched-subunit amino acid transport system substrate-binding protein
MRSNARRGTMTLLAGLLLISVLSLGATTAGAVQTIKVAGLAPEASFPGAQVGAEAYFKYINSTNYLKGVKIQFVTMANDDQDPATALTDVRQLVTQDSVFAIVPDLSTVNPGTYLKEEKIPYVGWAIDGTYCSTSPSTSIWGFGYSGCVVPSNPPIMPDNYGQLYAYVKGKTGLAHPTLAMFSNDDASGETSVKLQSVEMNGVGFKVVYNKAPVPITATDYTPYVEALLSSASGKQPDVIVCQLTAQCIPIWTALKNDGFSGTFYTPLGPISALASALAGTVTVAYYNTSPNPGLTDLENQLNAFSPGTQPTGYANVPAYFGAAMFVQAVHIVQTKKQAITPTNVQKALSTITFKIPGLVGPVKYPASTVLSSPGCSQLVAYTGGTTKALYPYTCNYKTFKVTAKAESAS